MKYRELILRGKQSLQFQDGTLAKLDVQPVGDDYILRIYFESGTVLTLFQAVDISERSEDPILYAIEGQSVDLVLLLGGREAYCISSEATIVAKITLFRKMGEEEYWTTIVVSQDTVTIVIYEGGILLIDSLFRVRFHEKKLFNDRLVAIEKDRLRFVRDDSLEWDFSLTDGTASFR